MDIALLAGNLTDAPDLSYTQGGTAVANVTLATNDRYKDRDGELQEDTVYHDLVIWGDQGEVLSEYAEKGQFIVVRGTHETSEWEDDDGNTRRDREIKVLEFDFGPQQSASVQQDESTSEQEPTKETAGGGDDDFEPDDDLPF